jgi:hypothetical protein
MTHEPSANDAARRLRASNLRTALVLASIAAVFFVGVIAARVFAGPETGVSVLGAVVLLFLVLAIGRNLRK